MTPEERLDRIDRIIEETAALQKANAIAIGQLTDQVKANDVAVNKLIESQQALVGIHETLINSHIRLTDTLDQLAKLWMRSPN